ncbi:unnamed protein product, partial [Iphiclides podalirius]
MREGYAQYILRFGSAGRRNRCVRPRWCRRRGPADKAASVWTSPPPPPLASGPPAPLPPPRLIYYTDTRID